MTRKTGDTDEAKDQTPEAGSDVEAKASGESDIAGVEGVPTVNPNTTADPEVEETPEVPLPFGITERPTSGPLAAPIMVSQPPTNPDPSAADEPEEPPKAKRGHVFVTYRGVAGLYSHGDYHFRPGVPVETPKALAEELLTTPFEQFDVEETSSGGSRRNEGPHRAG